LEGEKRGSTPRRKGKEASNGVRMGGSTGRGVKRVSRRRGKEKFLKRERERKEGTATRNDSRILFPLEKKKERAFKREGGRGSLKEEDRRGGKTLLGESTYTLKERRGATSWPKGGGKIFEKRKGEESQGSVVFENNPRRNGKPDLPIVRGGEDKGTLPPEKKGREERYQFNITARANENRHFSLEGKGGKRGGGLLSP